VNKSLHSLPAAYPNSASHQQQHIKVQDGSLKRAPDFITVTRGPGMRSNLSCGLDTAKGLAVAWQIPLLAVHHMQAHALTPRIVHTLNSNSSSSNLQPKFPFLSLLVSGGHSMLIHSKSLTEHKTLATTADIAIGEALDKIGRLVLPDEIQAEMKDISYAKHLSSYAFPSSTSYAKYQPPSTRRAECENTTTEFGWHIPTPFTQTRQLSFSFSGIASEVRRLFTLRTTSNLALSEQERLSFARSALTVSFNHLASRTVIALEKLRAEKQPLDTLVVSGGVAANSFLRHVLRRFLDVRGFREVELVFPPVELCTDNAAMIAWCGMEMFEAGWRSELGVRAIRRWSMDSGEGEGEEGRGGILGVDGWYNVRDVPSLY
jgi:N6-L-threonylcarbamoyladenine synthase